MKAPWTSKQIAIEVSYGLSSYRSIITIIVRLHNDGNIFHKGYDFMFADGSVLNEKTAASKSLIIIFFGIWNFFYHHFSIIFRQLSHMLLSQGLPLWQWSQTASSQYQHSAIKAGSFLLNAF